MTKFRFKKSDYLILTEEPLAGSTFINWIKVLIENKFKVDWQFYPRALYVTIMSLTLIPLKFLEKSQYDPILKNVKISPPIFIVGHWRSGTTFLHYLMGQDKNIAYVSTLQTMAPSLILKYEDMVKKIVEKDLPDKRPMDDLEMKTDLPYEEEYAIANLCQYSFYHGWYFPRNLYYYFKKYGIFKGVEENIINEWKNTYQYLLKKITLKYKRKRIMLKNLVNTGRIKLLLEMFPDAKFIHIYRNPYKVYLSTWKLYKKILPIFSLQHISNEKLDKFIIKIYKNLYEKYLKERSLIPKNNIIEISYEKFIKDPVNTLEKIYNKLNIDGFDEAKNSFQKYANKHKDYKPDKYKITDKIKEKIYQEWGFTFKEFGYKK